MISARDLIWVLRFPLQEVSDWISLARPFHLDYGAVAEVSLYLAGGSCEASHSSIHPSAWKKSNSTKFAVARSSSRSPLGVALRGDRGGATRRVRHKLAPRWPHLWRGIVASGHRLLRSNFLGILGTPLGRVATDYGPSAVRPERGLAPKVASDPKAPKEEGPSVVPFTAAQIRL